MTEVYLSSVRSLRFRHLERYPKVIVKELTKRVVETFARTVHHPVSLTMSEE